MDVSQRGLRRGLARAVGRPGIWPILVLFAAITFLQFSSYYGHASYLSDLTSNLGLHRYTVERILYLLPITWAGFVYGRKGAAVVSLVAVSCMLPHALFKSTVSEDALIETGLVFLVGNLIGYSLESLREERKRRDQLEAAQEELRSQLKVIEDNREHLRFVLQHATHAQEEERKRIARELHDDTIQALVIHSQQIHELNTDVKRLSEPASSQLEELQRQTINMIQELRRLSQDLRPAALDRLGLLPTLRQLASDIAAHSGMAVEVRVIGIQRRLPPEMELVLFRIVQEALRNVWKHSQATMAKTTIEFVEGKTKVTVSDNGKGFNVHQIMDEPGHGKLGLAGMRERAQLLGGTLTVTSEPGKGTTLTAELPV